VVVEGLAYEASDRELEVEHIALDTPAERQDSRWVRLVPGLISGRRIRRSPVSLQPPVPAPHPELVPDPVLAEIHGPNPGLLPDPGLGEWHGDRAERFRS
jgi:hypothetical protein